MVSTLIVVGTRSIIFSISNIYRSIWAYASIHDLLEIIKTTLLSSLVSTTALLFYNRFHQHSRMVPVLDTLLLLSFLCFRSFSWRIIRDYYLDDSFHKGKPILLIGAGKHGVNLLSEIRRHPELSLNPVGFLDDDLTKQGAHIHGLPILGTTNAIEVILKKYSIEEVIITSDKIQGKGISSINAVCEANKIKVKILPSFGDIFCGKVGINQLREVRVEDLLGRDIVNLEVESIKSYLKGHTILISGAAGSIGSEIVRQVSQFEPKQVILLDSAETPLYEIEYELKIDNQFHIDYQAVICDVKNVSRLSYVFELFKPSVVFHCAAYKHVPLMEAHPSEAVLNNIMGTKNIADVSRFTGIQKFVMISTDKAVNPVNIMGASKRIAELYIQHIAGTSKTKFITVRFGNVLGSNGSVIPRFKQQIEAGGPVTVTHPDIIRYFMTIPEASQLVLQAGSMGNKGEIFLLDMGEPVKILDLAEEMIRLSGFQPYKEIDIVFSGLRPGEKLYEELLLGIEGIKKTHHPKIMIANAAGVSDSVTLLEKLDQLFRAAKSNKKTEIYNLFKELVPEYQRHEEYVVTSIHKNRG